MLSKWIKLLNLLGILDNIIGSISGELRKSLVEGLKKARDPTINIKAQVFNRSSPISNHNSQQYCFPLLITPHALRFN